MRAPTARPSEKSTAANVNADFRVSESTTDWILKRPEGAAPEPGWFISF